MEVAPLMCGISGIVYWDGRPPDAGRAAAMVRALHHRGPDGDGVWTGGGAALCHNRLAIIDLATGQQPMVGEDGRFVLVYNGELYNFRELRIELEREGARFHTCSDTEVVLASYARWGRSCVERFRGMFAFAIWDAAARSLFVARDRLGIKPLFYAQTPAFFAFASELQALVSLPELGRDVDLGALDLYLHYQYVPAPLTIYTGARKLEPARSLLVDAGNPAATPQSYWRVRFEPDHTVSEREWIDRLDQTIGESVKCHLVSDVPFGAFLSGGIDSSIVAYHMSRHMTQPVRTFTIGFDDAAYDESAQAKAVASAIGAEHTCDVVHVDKYDLLDDLIFRLARHYGEPFADSSAIPSYCVSAAARAHVKMVLSGDGGDELFAGYNTYPNILKSCEPPVRWWQRLRGGGSANGSSLLDRALAPPSESALAQYNLYYAYFNDDMRRALYRPEIARTIVGVDRHNLYKELFDSAPAADCLSALQFLDLKMYLPGDILAKVDVASMFNSLEVRVPLLDHYVVELAAKIPPELKLFGPNGVLEQKYLLKRYVNRLLPGDAFQRPKHGFGVPIGRWFGGDLYVRVRDRLLEPDTILSRLFAGQAVESLVTTPTAAQNNAPRIWSLLFLRAWAEDFGISLP